MMFISAFIKRLKKKGELGKMKKWGDRRDGTLLRKIDSMHYFMPLIFPDRADNEAYMTMDIDLDRVEEFINSYNVDKPEDQRLTIFGIIITALLKTVYNRPDLNRFIKNKNLYQRNELTAAFVVKKELSDDASETLARVVACADDDVATVQQKVNNQIEKCKTEADESTEAMDFLQKIPIKGLIGIVIRWLDKHGWVPQSIIASDPFQCTVVFTNLGSIGMNIGYHHLNNWGTNSIFCVVGKKTHKPVYDRNGNVKMKRVISLSFTVDERISDGFYFAKSLRLLKKYIEKPELLLGKFNEGK